MMKRLVTIILAALFCFSLLPLFSQADEADEDIIEKLWEEKRAYDYDGRYAEVGQEFTYSVRFDETVDSVFWFLYTDQAKDYPLTWMFLSDEDYPDTNDYAQFTELQKELMYYSTGLPRYGNGIFYNAELYEILKRRCCEPPLFALVKELNITREEMEIAEKRCRETPEFILNAFVDFSDYQSMVKSQGEWTHLIDVNDPSHTHARFVLDALYLKDETAALALLLRPWALYIDGVPWNYISMCSPSENIDRVSRINRHNKTLTDIYKDKKISQIDRRGLEHFIGFMKKALDAHERQETVWYVEFMQNEIEPMHSALNLLSKYTQAPPQTGARTGVYFAAAGLSALTLGAGALLLRRKKRRLDG